VTHHVLANFDRDDIAWLKPLVQAMVEAAPLLATDDDAGFMNKVALLTAPAKSKPPKPGARDLP
jgi:PTH1 family peptidyl-tRNA hydrolase